MVSSLCTALGRMHRDPKASPTCVPPSAHPQFLATGLTLAASILLCTAAKENVGQTGRTATQPITNR